jgi:hypothetical protein
MGRAFPVPAYRRADGLSTSRTGALTGPALPVPARRTPAAAAACPYGESACVGVSVRVVARWPGAESPARASDRRTDTSPRPVSETMPAVLIGSELEHLRRRYAHLSPRKPAATPQETGQRRAGETEPCPKVHCSRRITVSSGTMASHCSSVPNGGSTIRTVGPHAAWRQRSFARNRGPLRDQSVSLAPPVQIGLVVGRRGASTEVQATGRPI